jgi:hypothetical protein
LNVDQDEAAADDEEKRRARSRSRSHSRSPISPACSVELLSPGGAPTSPANQQRCHSASSFSSRASSSSSTSSPSSRSCSSSVISPDNKQQQLQQQQQQRPAQQQELVKSESQASSKEQQFANAVNVINAAMAKAHSSQRHLGKAYTSTNNGLKLEHPHPQQQQQLGGSNGQAGAKLEENQFGQTQLNGAVGNVGGGAGNSSQQEQQALQAAAAANSFLYGGLSPAAAALFPRLYAANFLSGVGSPHPHSAVGPLPPSSSATTAGLLTTVPHLIERTSAAMAEHHQQQQQSGAGGVLGETGAPPFMSLSDPSIWAALGAGRPGGPLPSDLLAQTAQLMAQQRAASGNSG